MQYFLARNAPNPNIRVQTDSDSIQVRDEPNSIDLDSSGFDVEQVWIRAKVRFLLILTHIVICVK
jgi:hypothetical protein